MKRLLLLLAFMGIAAIGFSKDDVGKGNDNKIESTVTQNQRCCLYYTSSDGKRIEPDNSSSFVPTFDATILSNTYKDGIGIIVFNAPITTIGDGAFMNCSSLTSVTIPDSVTGIGEHAFMNCSSLHDFNGKFASADGRCLIIEGVLTSFAPAGLTEYTIPDSVTMIGDGAFKDCSSLTSVTIGDSVTTIGPSAFEGCSSLTSVTIPDSVTGIGDYAFMNCSSLTSVTIPDSVTGIEYNAFCGCRRLTSVTIGDSVTWIGDSAFKNCSSLTSVTIPDSVTTIGMEAFEGCSSLTSVTIGDSVTTIGSSAFGECSSLTSVTIPDSVTTIDGWAFEGCSSLHDFNGKFASADGRCLIINGLLTSFAPAGLTEYTIPDSVTTIDDGAFGDCSSLTSVTIPDSVTGIGDYAFMNCSSLHDFNGKFASADGRCLIINGLLTSFAPAGLTEYTIPDSVTMIGEAAFKDCSSLTSVTIPDSVTTIGVRAFVCCSSLTSVTIPDSVTWIGDSAFKNCSSLTSVYCKPTIPPTGYSSMFKSNAYGRKIYVPRESVASYKSASDWSDYADAIVGYNF